MLATDALTIYKASGPENKITYFENCRILHYHQHTKTLLQPRGSGPISLTILLEIIDQDWLNVLDFLIGPTVEFLAIDNSYCELLMTGSSKFPNLITPSVSSVCPRRLL